MQRASVLTTLSVGGVDVRVDCVDADLLPRGPGAERFYSTSCGRFDIALTARWSDSLDSPRGTVAFDSHGAWRLVRGRSELIFSFYADGDRPYKTARVADTLATGEVHLSRAYFTRRSVASLNPLEYPLDELLLLHWLSRGRGVEIHACGLADDRGRAFLFVGQSGAGKSTFARLTQGHMRLTPLSDERIVVRTDGATLLAYGTPWHGDAHLASPANGELSGVFFLRQAPAASVVPVAPAIATAGLLSCAFLPFHDRAAVESALSSVEKIAATVPCFDLSFARDPSVVGALAPHL